MKKELINIIILALVITNLILTAVIVFAVVPTLSGTNKLVTKIASVPDLELEDIDKTNRFLLRTLIEFYDYIAI